MESTMDRDLIDVVEMGGGVEYSSASLIESMSATGWANYGCVCEKGRLDSYLSKWSDASSGVSPQAVAFERDVDDEERFLGDSCYF